MFNPKRAESNYFVPDLIFGKENCVKNDKSLLHTAAIPLNFFSQSRLWVDQEGKMIVDDESKGDEQVESDHWCVTSWKFRLSTILLLKICQDNAVLISIAGSDARLE